MPDACGELVVPIEVRGVDLPGRRFPDSQSCDRVYDPVYLGIQRGRAGEAWVRADAERADFSPELRVRRREDGSANFLGPYAQGKPDDRFVYLVWAEKRDGRMEMFRRLKLRLGHITWERVLAAVDGHTLRVELSLTDRRGGPLCATPPAELVRWS